MWYIYLLQDNAIANYSEYDFAGFQILKKHINIIYDSLGNICNEDYKILNNNLEQHIVKYINDMKIDKVNLVVYNYGIDNAIVLLNNYNNNNKNYTNTSAKSLLFIIFYNIFNIYYVADYTLDSKSNPYCTEHHTINAIIVIQRFWRNILYYRREIKRYTINNDITALIEIINNQIKPLPAKRVLIYLVKKFKKRISKTLRI